MGGGAVSFLLSMFGSSRCARTALVAALIGVGGIVALSVPAHADTVVGCDTGGLVVAISDANTAGGGTLDLAGGCTYQVVTGGYGGGGDDGLPAITTPITVHGNGAKIVRVSSAPDFRLIEVDASGALTADSLTVTGGKDCCAGGGIFNYGSVTLTNSIVSGNTATVGGGIENDGGHLVLDHTTVSHNLGKKGGGGINNEDNGTATLTDSTVLGNRATSSQSVGGGINNSGIAFPQSAGTLTVIDSTISGNRAIVTGGGISTWVGTATISGSTISANSTIQGGGGVGNFSGVLSVTNSTLSGNSTFDFGSAINSNGSTTVSDSTIAGNGGATAIYLHNSFALTASIVSANTSGNCSSAIPTSGGYNLDSDGSCALGAATDHSNVDPQLGPLQRNGGPTQTMAPSSLSPVVDAIPKGAGGCGSTIKTDQRGVSRPQGSGCDIGAYETGDLALQTLKATPKSVPSGSNVTFTATIINAGAAAATGVTVVSVFNPPINEGLTFVSVTTSQGTCPAVLPPTCNLGQIRAAGKATIKAVFTVNAPPASTVTDTPTISATSGDPITSNDTKTAKVTVT